MRVGRAVKHAKKRHFSTVLFDVGREYQPQMIPLWEIHNKRGEGVAIRYGPANAINVRRHLEKIGFPAAKVKKALQGQSDVVVRNSVLQEKQTPNGNTLQLHKTVITSNSGQFLGRGKVLVERYGAGENMGNLAAGTARVIRSNFELPPEALKKRMKRKRRE